MYIKRILEKDIQEGSKYFPVIAILGPRQSGKTTLAQKMFPNHVYTSLEDIDNREAAKNDPRTFLKMHRNEHGMIIDEFQYAPDLLSYIQTISDAEKKMGHFILTGSQNFLMNQAISQSLAGRVSLHTLLPLSSNELEQAGLLPDDIEDILYTGLYPAAYIRKIPPKRLYAQYIQTYLERDVRTLANIGDLSVFQTFIALCAERIGQPLNLTELGKACRMSDQTIKRWITILETSYIIYLLKPYEKTFGKRLIKRPKLFFYDPGLAYHLLQLKKDEIIDHPKRGNIFESFIIAEIVKHFYNHGERPTIFYWQDKNRHEIDCIVQYGRKVLAFEIKASRTANSRLFSGLKYWNDLSEDNNESNSFVIYAGSKKNISSYKNLISWQSLTTALKFF